jgi:hypothetical protein
MYINIKKLLCYKGEFDENVNPIYLLFKSIVMCDLVPYELEFKVHMKDIGFELKGNPIKLITTQCNRIQIDDVNFSDNEEIIKKLVNYMLDNEVNCSWYIFATSHRLYRENIKPSLELIK